MTRYVSSCFFTLFVLFLWRVEDIAEACRCLPQHPQQAFCDAEVVIRAKVVGKKAVSNDIKYDIQQIKMFKGCDQVIHAIFTDTTSCGVTLQINKEYLFTGKLETGRMYVTMCGYNPSWENLSAAQKKQLDSPLQKWLRLQDHPLHFPPLSDQHLSCVFVDRLGNRQWPEPCLYQEGRWVLCLVQGDGTTQEVVTGYWRLLNSTGHPLTAQSD